MRRAAGFCSSVGAAVLIAAVVMCPIVVLEWRKRGLAGSDFGKGATSSKNSEGIGFRSKVVKGGPSARDHAVPQHARRVQKARMSPETMSDIQHLGDTLPYIDVQQPIFSWATSP